MKSLFAVFSAAAVLALATACESQTVTNTPRSATEQMLISEAVETGISQADFKRYAGKKVLMEYTHLATQVDKEFLIAYTELAMARSGIILTPKAEEADYVVQLSCGVLATEMNKILLGSPTLPIPMPQTDLNLVVPEIPLFMKQTRSGHGRFFFNILEGKTRAPVEVIEGINAKTILTNWVILFIPFKTHNLKSMEAHPGNTTFLFPVQED